MTTTTSSDIICHIYQEPGHMKMHCPKKKDANQERDAKSVEAKSENLYPRLKAPRR